MMTNRNAARTTEEEHLQGWVRRERCSSTRPPVSRRRPGAVILTVGSPTCDAGPLSIDPLLLLQAWDIC